MFDYLKRTEDYGLVVKEYDNAVIGRNRNMAAGMSKGAIFNEKTDGYLNGFESTQEAGERYPDKEEVCQADHILLFLTRFRGCQPPAGQEKSHRLPRNHGLPAPKKLIVVGSGAIGMSFTTTTMQWTRWPW